MSDAEFGTNFTESEALLAVLSGADETAIRLVNDLMPGERSQLARAASRLALIADQMCESCKKFVPVSESVTTGGFSRAYRRIWHRPCLEAHKAAEVTEP